MEAQDEFQFKPINEGLGFHKKRPILNLDDPPKSAPQVEQSSPHQVFQQEETNPQKPFLGTDIQFDSEIDKKTFNETQNSIKPLMESNIFDRSASSTVASVTTETPLAWPHPSHPAPASPLNKAVTAPVTPTIAKAKQQTQALSQQKSQNVAPHFGAFLLDLFVIVGLGHILIVPLLLITQISPSYIVLNAQTDPALQISLFILFLSIMNFYLMTSRSFFGATLGEWSCDMILGDMQKRQSPIYPILVAWRCFLMTVTGVITFPFLGFLIGKDILGKLTFIRLNKSS